MHHAFRSPRIAASTGAGVPRRWPIAAFFLVVAVAAFPGPRLAWAEPHPAPLAVPDASAGAEEEMRPYAEVIEHTGVKIEMVPIPSGEFVMGSPESEPGRRDDEGPRHRVAIEPFWMAKYETTWDAYEIWMEDLDIARQRAFRRPRTPRDILAEEYQISQPTEPFCDMSFAMGKGDRPAICMTQLAARVFCKWLSAKTGRYYRLPTEAEWEYACRAGTTTAYSFGDDPALLPEHAWFRENSDEKYQRVGQKKPNAFGLFDMHGNVAEWVLDQHDETFYSRFTGAEPAVRPLAIPKTIYPRVIRGGSWDDDAENLRSAARVGSSEDWKAQDPQIPQSIWYHTDALHVGFRIVRPLIEPSEEEKASFWEKSEPVEDRKSE